MIPGLACTAVVLLFCACCSNPPPTLTTNDGFLLPVTPAQITYNDMATQYNKAIAPLDTLWARTDIDVEWYEVDKEGDRDYRRESGDGKFIMRRPIDTALLIEKFGKVYIWAGSNAEQYWMLDMVDGDNKIAYIGDFEKLGYPGNLAFPLPVRPDLVPVLLGLLPLPIDPDATESEQPAVQMYNGKYLVELRQAGLRMLIDTQTLRPTRVDLLDRLGYSTLTSKLTGQFSVEVEGQTEETWPIICERAEVYVTGYESRLTVEMDYATLGESKIRDQMFDFEALEKALRPDSVQSLDLE